MMTIERSEEKAATISTTGKSDVIITINIIVGIGI